MRLVVAAVAAVAMAAAAADVGAAEAQDTWWQTALVYQVYPRSYRDSDGDGIGDLNGIREKLPYLQALGVDALWLSPIFLSPMRDFGYDITDYRQIAPEYGTMDDFDSLVSEGRQLGLRILLDFVPNHTSDESEWFVRSARREPGYEEYYVWADGKPDPGDPTATLPPSNWLSVFRRSAWQWQPARGQYYLHQFAVGQPDLNYRNPKVRDEMKDVVKFWLDKGVGGFRVDAVNFMYEVDPQEFGGAYPDEPLSGSTSDPDDYEYLRHIYSKDLPPTYEVIYEWKGLLDNRSREDGEGKLMLTEAYTDFSLLMQYYGSGSEDGSIPFNFEWLAIDKHSSARDMKFAIDKWMTYMPNGKTANWVNGNHDTSRMATRHGAARVDGVNMLALLLPGVAVTYQGEEIGMTDGYVSWEDTVDPQACNTEDPVNYASKSRDPARTPFHWDASAHAGFSNTSGATWLPVADNYRTVNVAAQMAAANSHYHFYKDVVNIRKSVPVRLGDLEVKALSDDMLVVMRSLPGYPAVVGMFNLAESEQTVDLAPFRTLPQELVVVASGVDSALPKGARVQKRAVQLAAHSALVLQSRRPLPPAPPALDVPPALSALRAT